MVLTADDGPILSDQNHAMLKFTEEMRREFWLVMLGLFDEEAWENILSNKASN
jgi:hypothetical protein